MAALGAAMPWVPSAGVQKTAVQARRDSVLADMTHTPLMEVSPDEVPLMQ
jgi:hypothetical protein